MHHPKFGGVSGCEVREFLGLLCPASLEKFPHSQRANLLPPGVPISRWSWQLCGQSVLAAVPVRPPQSPWKHFHPLVSSGMCVGRESGAGKILPCANPLPSLLPITRSEQ